MWLALDNNSLCNIVQYLTFLNGLVFDSHACKNMIIRHSGVTFITLQLAMKMVGANIV